MPEISELRGEIAVTARQAWDLDDEEISDFRRNLMDVAEQNDIKDEFQDCAEELNFAQCLEDYAEEVDLDEDLDNEWEGAPDGLMDQLRDVGDVWDAQARDEARSIAYEANLDELNRKCAQGKTGDVQDEIDMEVVDERTNIGTSITSFAECVEAVSAAQGVSDALKTAWDVDG